MPPPTPSQEDLRGPPTPQTGGAAGALTKAERMVREERPDEEIERLAGVTLSDMLTLRAPCAPRSPGADMAGHGGW